MTATLVVERSSLLTGPETKPYRPIGKILEMFGRRDRELVLEGPADCVAGETRIYDPTTGEQVRIDELYRQQRAPFVLTMDGPALATVPFIKGIAKLYRIVLADGRSCIVTQRHRLLTEMGWTFVGNLSRGQRLPVAEPCPPPSIGECDLQVSRPGAHGSMRTRAGSTDHCCRDSRRCDRQPQSVVGSARVLVPLLAGARGRIHDDPLADGQALGSGHSRPCRASGRRATSGYLLRSEAGLQGRSLVAERTAEYGDGSTLCAGPSPTTTLLPLPSVEDYPHFGHTPRHPAIAFEGSTSPSNYRGQWTTVATIEYERTDVYYDLTVPGAEHYLAEGIWHHNTGKSRGCLEKLHACMTKYPGAKAAMVRKTRRSLTSTAMDTFERWVCPEGQARLWGDLEYRYANGSRIYLFGMDDPEKVKSFEGDMIYVQEASELEQIDWEILTTRVTGRGAIMPYVQLLADMNPTNPDFWLYEREKAGSVAFVHVTHADNPTITPDRLDALKRLTGYQRDRLYLGLRVAAEGMYFEEWDPNVHVCAAFDPPADWTRWLSVDWGFADPWCVLWYARVPKDGTIYVYRELYKTQLREEEQAELIRQRSFGENIALRVLDPSMFNNRAESNRPSIASIYASICGTVYPGMNSRKPGWQTVRRAMATRDVLPSGEEITKAPRLRVMRERCPNLLRTLPAMVKDPLDPEDLADKVNGQKTEDHCVDTLRYGLVAEAQPPVPGKSRVAFGR